MNGHRFRGHILRKRYLQSPPKDQNATEMISEVEHADGRERDAYDQIDTRMGEPFCKRIKVKGE